MQKILALNYSIFVLLFFFVYLTSFSEIYQGYQILSDGWVTLFNGYQYKFTLDDKTWNDSRTTCRKWGGDLAVYGIQNMDARRSTSNRCYYAYYLRFNVVIFLFINFFIFAIVFETQAPCLWPSLAKSENIVFSRCCLFFL